MESLLEVRDISKHFLGIRALEKVNFRINPRERVGLVGDNGAGKSTLIKIIAGIQLPTEGEIYWEGKQVTMESPTVARELGIETIYQDLSLANNLTTANNFFLGRELTKSYLGGLVQLLDEKAMNARTEALLHQMNASIPTRKQVAFLSGGQRQAIAIMRVMLWNARLIIMDEPTAALGVAERRKVLDLVKELKLHGVSVLLISHNLPDVLEVTDRIYVIRRGHIVGEVETATASEHTLIQMMIGSEPAALRSK
ncbi:MAG TPA: ATP-binding cassette domain-containing protein [Terrimicrobiaceae bacterium]